MADSGKKTIMQSMTQSAIEAQSAAENERAKKKSVKVIKADDMSPETKTLPDETRPTPKGIGKSENDMGPTNPGDEMLKGAKLSYEANKQRMEMEKAMLKGASMGGMGAMQAKKKGGVIKDLKKAGFYDAKKDKAKRLDIINKVTTKPQRIEMVDKVFSAKKMAKGGTASSRADGCAVRGKTKA